MGGWRGWGNDVATTLSVRNLTSPRPRRAARRSPPPRFHQGLANTYAEPPSPIDFASYRAKIAAPGLVDKFEVRILVGSGLSRRLLGPHPPTTTAGRATAIETPPPAPARSTVALIFERFSPGPSPARHTRTPTPAHETHAHQRKLHTHRHSPLERAQAAYNGVSYPKAVARELDEVRQEHATMVGLWCCPGHCAAPPHLPYQTFHPPTTTATTTATKDATPPSDPRHHHATINATTATTTTTTATTMANRTTATTTSLDRGCGAVGG